jgi:archaellum component FlaC
MTCPYRLNERCQADDCYLNKCFGDCKRVLELEAEVSKLTTEVNKLEDQHPIHLQIKDSRIQELEAEVEKLKREARATAEALDESGEEGGKWLRERNAALDLAALLKSDYGTLCKEHLIHRDAYRAEVTAQYGADPTQWPSVLKKRIVELEDEVERLKYQLAESRADVQRLASANEPPPRISDVEVKTVSLYGFATEEKP